MRKTLILSALAGLLLFPSSVLAFSFFDVFQFFSTDKKVETTTEVFTEQDKRVAESKYGAWEEAYDKDNIKKVFQRDRNFILTEQEVNYLADKRIDELKDPAMTSVDIEFQEGKIKLEGYLTRTLEGNIEAIVQIKEENGREVPKIAKAKYKGFYFPSWAANMMLNKAIKEEVDFLYSHPKYKDLDVSINEERIKLDYSK